MKKAIRLRIRTASVSVAGWFTKHAQIHANIDAPDSPVGRERLTERA
jgi:hypothetical protein